MAAIEAYKSVISLVPQEVRAYNNLAIALENLGEIENAKKAYLQGLGISSSDISLQLNLLMFYIRTNQDEDACRLVKCLKGISETNGRLACMKAILEYRQTGNRNALMHAKGINSELTDYLLGVPKE